MKCTDSYAEVILMQKLFIHMFELQYCNINILFAGPLVFLFCFFSPLPLSIP